MDPLNTPGSQQASFFVHLLPYVEQAPLYQLCLTDPNSVNRGIIIPAYLSPSDYSQINNGAGSVNFAVNLRLWQQAGQNNMMAPTTLFAEEGRPLPKVKMPATFNPDGTSYTLLFATKMQVCGANVSTLINAKPVLAGVSTGPYFGWTNATLANQSLPSANLGWQPAPTTSACIADANLAQSFYPQAIQVALCDASVRSVSANVSFGRWTRALTPNGGEELPPDWSE